MDCDSFWVKNKDVLKYKTDIVYLFYVWISLVNSKSSKEYGFRLFEIKQTMSTTPRSVNLHFTYRTKTKSDIIFI